MIDDDSVLIMMFTKWSFFNGGFLMIILSILADILC